MHRPDLGVVLGLYRAEHRRDLLEGALNLGIRALDTSFNYLDFASHRTLAQVAGDLLPQFTISTKIGFFPRDKQAHHSLEPDRLREAAEQTAEDLERAPDVLLLHNPESSLAHPPTDKAREVLAEAFGALAQAAEDGLCGQWGLSTWKPLPLLSAVGPDTAKPDVLMTRAGLLVDAATLRAGEELAAALRIEPEGRWGMSPFGGDGQHRIWNVFDATMFLDRDQEASNLQAALRVAFEVPAVARVAVGTGNVHHLKELADAVTLRLDQARLSNYRAVINERRS
ncbi:aldo/keto reductase [Streptacidiphilus fuscans]|uniref:Aldo/keto reductase n=1 Tax=Streptacidiphilus fuscans TaxID=2789292 RepID=A0A931FFR1_9ACTN|nr:aldo/keto reductase [Streptacidiphilus fuscans]MBF9071883.1 aldo/keto reductase [Streptacidiphilus fuscans]